MFKEISVRDMKSSAEQIHQKHADEVKVCAILGFYHFFLQQWAVVHFLNNSFVSCSKHFDL